MANLKDAMKKAKATGKTQMVTEPMNEKSEIKVAINIRLDHDVLTWLKKSAADIGIPYQTYANLLLRRAMRGEAIINVGVPAGYPALSPDEALAADYKVSESSYSMKDIVARLEALEKKSSGKAR